MDFSLLGSSKGYSKNDLTPVNLSGVVVPWSKSFSINKESEFKIVCSSSLEYFIIADSEWKDVFARYCWDKVKVVGLLNINNMTLIPQKVIPNRPQSEMDNVIDFAAWKARKLVKKLIKNINDSVVVPVAVSIGITHPKTI